MSDQHLIRDVRSADRPAWQDLWEQYLVFYEADLPPDLTPFLWQRFFDADDPVSCIVAEVEGTPVGIAHFYPHADTWEDGPTCYLQDLIVAVPHRRSGIGRSLILELHRRCQHNGWRLLHWDTQADNTRARRLYDDLTGGTNDFVGYHMKVPPL